MTRHAKALSPNNGELNHGLPPVGVPRRYGTASKVAIAPTVSPDGRKVTLFYWGGMCDDHANAEVNEEPASVTIPIVVTPRHEDCGLAAIRDKVTDHLDKPVGSRRLLDGALRSSSGSAWPVLHTGSVGLVGARVGGLLEHVCVSRHVQRSPRLGDPASCGGSRHAGVSSSGPPRSAIRCGHGRQRQPRSTGRQVRRLEGRIQWKLELGPHLPRVSCACRLEKGSSTPASCLAPAVGFSRRAERLAGPVRASSSAHLCPDASLERVRTQEPHLLLVETCLHLTHHDVVDALLVAQFEERLAPPTDEGE